MKDTRLFRRFHVLHSWSGSAGSAPERERPPSTSLVRVRAVPPGLWTSLFSALVLACLLLPVAEPARARQSLPTPRSVLLGHVGHLCSLEFSWDGRWLASLSSDGCVMLWDPVTARLERMFSSEGVWSQSIAFSPDGEVLATSGNASDSVLWNVGSGERVGSSAGFSAPKPLLAFLPSGWIIEVTPKNATISRINPSTGQVHRLPVARSVGTACIAVARNGGTFALGLEDGTIEVWETETFRILATFQPHCMRVRALAFSPSGRTLASISQHDRDVTLWDLDRGMRRYSFPPPASQPCSLAYSPDGSTLAVGATDGAINLWNPVDGHGIKTFQGHYRGVHALAFSPDGTILATGGAELTDRHEPEVKLWEMSELMRIIPYSRIRTGPHGR
jgi:WD40 repeat protein